MPLSSSGWTRCVAVMTRLRMIDIRILDLIIGSSTPLPTFFQGRRPLAFILSETSSFGSASCARRRPSFQRGA